MAFEHSHAPISTLERRTVQTTENRVLYTVTETRETGCALRHVKVQTVTSATVAVAERREMMLEEAL
jgi:hypothetical protein